MCFPATKTSFNAEALSNRRAMVRARIDGTGCREVTLTFLADNPDAYCVKGTRLDWSSVPCARPDASREAVRMHSHVAVRQPIDPKTMPVIEHLANGDDKPCARVPFFGDKHPDTILDLRQGADPAFGPADRAERCATVNVRRPAFRAGRAFPSRRRQASLVWRDDRRARAESPQRATHWNS